MANEETPKVPKEPTKSATKAPSAGKAPKINDATAPKATNGTPSTPITPKAPSTSKNISVESAKEAELQKVAEGQTPTQPNKKKNAKKLIFLLLLLLLIAAIAVAAVLVIPNLLNTEKEPELQLTNPGSQGAVEQLDFTTPVTEYIWGTPIERGIAVQNTGESDILLCFKLEIYDDANGTIPAFITATPSLRSGLWTTHIVTETLDDGTTINSVYYYYNSVLASGTTNVLLLFDNYVVTAEDDVANDYAERTVYSRVTVQYTNATEESLNGATADCWQDCPEDWRSRLNLE